MDDRKFVIAVVIPVYNRKSVTLSCLYQLQALDTRGMDISIIIVDDGSTDGTSEAIRAQHPEIILLCGNGNLWWTGATKLGVKYALYHYNCDYILTLNDEDVVMKSVKSLAKQYPSTFAPVRKYLVTRMPEKLHIEALILISRMNGDKANGNC